MAAEGLCAPRRRGVWMGDCRAAEETGMAERLCAPRGTGNGSPHKLRMRAVKRVTLRAATAVTTLSDG